MKFFDQSKPIEQQLRRHIEDLILEGRIGTVESIPSAREIAMNYKVNTVTVNETVRELLKDGILELKRGAGIRASSQAAERISSCRKEMDLAGVASSGKRSNSPLLNVSKHLSWC